MSDVGKFISIVALHFPTPRKSEDPEYAAWLASMMLVLRPFDDDVLAEAAQEIVTTRTIKDGRFFPLPAECTVICNRIAARKHAEKTPLLSTDKRDQSPWAGWRTTLADDLMQSASGKQASKEGWGLAFHNFCHENGCAPSTPQEIARCKSQRQSLDEGMRILMSGEPVFARDALLRIGQTMLVRNDEFKAKAGGKAA
jgi:hypothetical protein